jgi:hypothetical protein
MPKAARRKRKGSSARPQAAQRITTSESAASGGELAAKGKASGRPNAGVGGYQGLFMPALVALGCWGLAVSFTFFSTDPNRLLWGGIAALMGIMWSFSFWLRLRRLQQK